MFVILGSRCLTGSALLDCHVLEGFGIYMIGILNSSSGVWNPITGTPILKAFRYIEPGCVDLRHLQGVDGQEDACPPVAFIIDLIHVCH